MRLRRKQTTPDNLPAPPDGSGRSAQPEDSGMPAKLLSHVLESSARVQAPAVRAYVARLRRANPDASPSELVTKLEKHYLAAVMASGAAVGSAAAFPGIGTLAALSAVWLALVAWIIWVEFPELTPTKKNHEDTERKHTSAT